MADPQAEREKLEEILQPSDKARAFKITIIFRRKLSPNYARAVELAKKNPAYREDGTDDSVRHSATYTPDEVDDLFDLFRLVHEWDDTEVLVNHKRLPYGHQLWLPLMWFYRIR
jgi:hypothetical protein